MVKVNVATLKSELSKYLKIAKNGEAVVVTSHGREIAKIGPAPLISGSPVDWSEFKKKFPGAKPRKKGTSAARLIRQIRDEE